MKCRTWGGSDEVDLAQVPKQDGFSSHGLMEGICVSLSIEGLGRVGPSHPYIDSFSEPSSGHAHLDMKQTILTGDALITDLPTSAGSPKLRIVGRTDCVGKAIRKVF